MHLHTLSICTFTHYQHALSLTHSSPWTGSGSGAVHKEKFNFDSPHACVVYDAGELSLIEYGK
jgi:hypothetical protein